MIIKTLHHVHDICIRENISEEEFVNILHNEGYKKIYISEHYPLASYGEHDQFYGEVKYKDRPNYEQLLNFKLKLKNACKKYNIELIFGTEIEMPKMNRDFFLDVKNNPIFEYAIFGNHFYKVETFNDEKKTSWNDIAPKFIEDMHTFKTTKNFIERKNLEIYLENTEAALKSGIFSLFAHPDIWINEYAKIDENSEWLINELIKLIKKYKIPIGFNSKRVNQEKWNQLSCPCPFFWKKIAKTNIKVIIEADCHKIKDVTKKKIYKAYELACSWGLEKNIVDDIKPIFFTKKIRYEKISNIKDEQLKKIINWENLYDAPYNQKQIQDMISNKSYSFYLFYMNNIMCGYCIILNTDICEILKIYVDKIFQGNKIAFNFIKKLKNKKINVEVNEKNIYAIGFYKSLGFKIINKREKYYNNQDDALILELTN